MQYKRTFAIQTAWFYYRLTQCFGSALVSMLIRIQRFSPIWIRMRLCIQGFDDQNKNRTKFSYPQTNTRVSSSRKACSPPKRTSSTSKLEISSLISIFVGHFSLLDPDPAVQNQCGNIRIRIRNTGQCIVMLNWIEKFAAFKNMLWIVSVTIVLQMSKEFCSRCRKAFLQCYLVPVLAFQFNAVQEEFQFIFCRICALYSLVNPQFQQNCNLSNFCC